MANVSALITALGTGGAGAVVVAAIHGFNDERVRRRTEKKAAATAPLEVKSLELRIAETAGEIQHRTMEDLSRAYTDLEARFEKYRKDTDEQREKDRKDAEERRDRDLKEADRMREHDRQELVDARDEIRRLKDRIQDQEATIQNLQFELQQARSGP